jgi:hypothetical protein
MSWSAQSTFLEFQAVIMLEAVEGGALEVQLVLR